MAAPETETDVRPEKMSSGEALTEILRVVHDIQDRMIRTEEVVSLIVDQVQEVAASGLGNLLGGLTAGSVNGDSEHSEDPS